METRTLGSELQWARKKKKLRQEDVALELKCDRHLVSDWERDTAQPDAAQRRKLALFLGLSVGLLNSLFIPPLPALGRTPYAFCSRKPRYLPVGDKPPWKRILALFHACRLVYETLWKLLNARVDRECIRRFFMKVQLDSKHEALAWMKLLAAGMLTHWLAPLKSGYRDLPVIDPETYRVVGDCRVPALVRDGPHPAVIFIQNTLLTRNGGPMRPDGLVGVKVNGVMRWCVAEFDGEGYVGVERGRESHLKMAVVRFSVPEIWDADFASLFWRRIHAALGVRG